MENSDGSRTQPHRESADPSVSWKVLNAWNAGCSPDNAGLQGPQVDPKSEPRKFPVTPSRELQRYGLPVWTSDGLLTLSYERLHHRIHQYLDGHSFNGSDHSCYGSVRLDCPLRTRLLIEIVNLGLAPATLIFGVWGINMARSSGNDQETPPRGNGTNDGQERGNSNARKLHPFPFANRVNRWPAGPDGVHSAQYLD